MEKKFRSIVEQSNDAIIITDAQGKIVEWNQSAENIFGLKKSITAGKCFCDILFNMFIEDNKNLKLYKQCKKEMLISVNQNNTIASSSPHLKEIEIVPSDGVHRIIEMSIFPFHTPHGTMIGNIVRDITEYKKMEKERENLIEDLQKALEKIKTLRGLIPICSYCKKVRNDEGFWQQVEVYVRDHSKADFTHGICPECEKKLYEEMENMK